MRPGLNRPARRSRRAGIDRIGFSRGNQRSRYRPARGTYWTWAAIGLGNEASGLLFELRDARSGVLDSLADAGRLARLDEVQHGQDHQADDRGDARVLAYRADEVINREGERETGHARGRGVRAQAAECPSATPTNAKRRSLAPTTRLWGERFKQATLMFTWIEPDRRINQTARGLRPPIDPMGSAPTRDAGKNRVTSRHLR